MGQLGDDIQENPKKFWSFYSVKTKTRKLSLAIKKDVNCSFLVTDTLEKANLFNNYFNSVLVNLVMNLCHLDTIPFYHHYENSPMLLSQ